MADRRTPPHMEFWGDLQRRVDLEWRIIAAALMLLTALLSYFDDAIGLSRLNHVFYDQTLAASVQRSANDKLVIIAIDDGSLDQIGRWPWRRTVHAQLLDQLHEAKAVGLDIVFNEADFRHPGDDQKLADAVSRQGRVVLPLILHGGGQTVDHPLPFLEKAANSLGYVNVYPDRDGVIRSIRLETTLPSNERVLHFVLAMIKTAGDGSVVSKLIRDPGARPALIPYVGAPGHFTVYPYASVLNGDIPASSFKDKYVLVGPWATGLGDAFPTPLSHQGESMSGVELLANGLQSALNNRWIQSPGRWPGVLLAVLPVLLACVLLRRMSPRRSFFITIAILLTIFIADWLLMRFAGAWAAPTASVIGVALVYPVWNWRSQEAALQHIDRELLKLHDEQPFHNRASLHKTPMQRDRSLPARVTELHNAIAQVRDLRDKEVQAQRQRQVTLQFLSHDMRAPQSSILALTELQKDPQAALPQPVLLQRIDQYVLKTLALVDSFVQLARAESMTIAYQSTDLIDLLAQVCDDCWALARKRNIAILYTHSQTAAYTDADRSLLSRAFENLIDNAIKYSPGDTQIECRLGPHGDYWEVIVQDQGPGISQAQQASLFTPFTRFDGAARHPSGSGLGLAFVKTVIGRHHGQITVQSSEDRGVAFVVRLPKTDSAAKKKPPSL